MAWGGLLALALLSLVGESAGVRVQPHLVSARASASALPQDRLHFGLSNQPGDLGWMTSSGVPWRYRYTYLAGGVNTGKGWETWNTPAGAFASYYMKASGDNGYLPVLTYYELMP